MASIKQQKNINKLQAHIEIFDKADNWNEITCRCGMCLKSFKGFFCETPDGRVCINCAADVYDYFVSTHEIAAWPYSRFISALSGGESLRWRLTILSRYIEAVKTAQRQKSDVNAMHRLLVSNLDNWIDHPLKDAVCKLAFGAATWVGKPMLPMLLAYQDKQDPWLIYCDIALCVSRIAPDDKRVQEFFEKALKHPVPEARTKIIGILSEHKSIWARNILKELRKDANLAEQLTAIPIPDELSPLETVIIENYKLDVLKSIYSSYLIFVFQEISFTVNKNAFAVGKLTKRQLVWAFAQVFSQKDLFDKLLSILPPGVIQVLNRLTWEKGEHSRLPRIWEDFLNDILNKIDPLIPEPTLSVFRLKEHPELIELMARDEILQKCVLKAEGYHVLIPVQNLNKVKKRLEAFGYFIDHLK